MCGLQEGLTEILELVLDQELQKYNHLLEEMRDSLESALCGIEGLNLVTDEIGQLLESIKEGELRQKYDNLGCLKTTAATRECCWPLLARGPPRPQTAPSTAPGS